MFKNYPELRVKMGTLYTSLPGSNKLLIRLEIYDLQSLFPSDSPFKMQA